MRFYQYPHIDNYHKFTSQILSNSDLPDMLSFSGTIKLHGTNGAVCQNADGLIYTQSRNRIITDTDDNLGFSQFVTSRLCEFERIFRYIRASNDNDNNSTIVLFGEFCGKGVQSNVGIGSFEKFFVIFDIFIDDQTKRTSVWANMKDMVDGVFSCKDNDKRIFNIAQFDTFHICIPTNDMASVGPLLDEMSENIGNSCPVAKFLRGKEECEENKSKCNSACNQGEGIVWKCDNYQSHENLENPFWFKSKCKLFSKRPPPRQQNAMNKAEISVVANEFADTFVTPMRVSQGVAYLKEFNHPISIQSMGIFLTWIVDDVMREDGYDIDPKISIVYKKAISAKARPIFTDIASPASGPENLKPDLCQLQQETVL